METYLVMECHVLSDQFETDAERSPLAMIHSVNEFQPFIQEIREAETARKTLERIENGDEEFFDEEDNYLLSQEEEDALVAAAKFGLFYEFYKWENGKFTLFHSTEE